jgi:hypothetical protein
VLVRVRVPVLVTVRVRVLVLVTVRVRVLVLKLKLKLQLMSIATQMPMTVLAPMRSMRRNDFGFKYGQSVFKTVTVMKKMPLRNERAPSPKFRVSHWVSQMNC